MLISGLNNSSYQGYPFDKAVALIVQELKTNISTISTANTKVKLLLKSSLSLGYPVADVVSVNRKILTENDGGTMIVLVEVSGMGVFGHGGDFPLEYCEFLAQSANASLLQILLDVYNHYLLVNYYLRFNIDKLFNAQGSPALHAVKELHEATIQQNRMENLRYRFVREFGASIRLRLYKSNNCYAGFCIRQPLSLFRLSQQVPNTNAYQRLSSLNIYRVDVIGVPLSSFIAFKRGENLARIKKEICSMLAHVKIILIKFVVVEDKEVKRNLLGISSFLTNSGGDGLLQAYWMIKQKASQ